MARVSRQGGKRRAPAKSITPTSERGQRTRAALVRAARHVFERDGYLNARVTDITETANVASGTFYTYFNSKDEIFEAVVESLEEDMLHLHVRERIGDDPVALICAANEAYLEAYERNARLMVVFEQVAQIDDHFRDLRRKRSDAFLKRNAKVIEDLQRGGRADPALDPLVAAEALSWMVSRMAYSVFGLGRPVPIDVLTRTLNQLWLNALRIAEPAADRERD